MNIAQKAVTKKMDYINERISHGPLNALEFTHMIEILSTLKGEGQLAVGIRVYFSNPDRQNQDQTLRQLGDQCMDDIFTMVCAVGQAAVIYLLRYVAN